MSGFLPIGHQLYCVSYMNVKSSIVMSTSCGLMIQPRASDTSRLISQRRDAVKSRELHFHLGAMDAEKNLPTLIGKLKIDWLDFPVDDILQQFTTLKEGILRGVFKQKAARAWFGCRAFFFLAQPNER